MAASEDKADVTWEFISALGLDSSQQSLLIELVLLLTHHGAVSHTHGLWTAYQMEYGKTPNCATLGVRSMKEYIEKISSILAQDTNGTITLTVQGQLYAKSLIDMVAKKIPVTEGTVAKEKSVERDGKSPVTVETTEKNDGEEVGVAQVPRMVVNPGQNLSMLMGNSFMVNPFPQAQMCWSMPGLPYPSPIRPITDLATTNLTRTTTRAPLDTPQRQTTPDVTTGLNDVTFGYSPHEATRDCTSQIAAPDVSTAHSDVTIRDVTFGDFPTREATSSPWKLETPTAVMKDDVSNVVIEVGALKLTAAQQAYLDELTLMLHERKSIKANKFWHTYQLMYQKSVSCAELNVKKMDNFLDKVELLITKDADKKPNVLLTKKGEIYARYLTSKTAVKTSKDAGGSDLMNSLVAGARQQNIPSVPTVSTLPITGGTFTNSAFTGPIPSQTVQNSSYPVMTQLNEKQRDLLETLVTILNTKDDMTSEAMWGQYKKTVWGGKLDNFPQFLALVKPVIAKVGVYGKNRVPTIGLTPHGKIYATCLTTGQKPPPDVEKVVALLPLNKAQRRLLVGLSLWLNDVKEVRETVIWNHYETDLRGGLNRKNFVDMVGDIIRNTDGMVSLTDVGKAYAVRLADESAGKSKALPPAAGHGPIFSEPPVLDRTFSGMMSPKSNGARPKTKYRPLEIPTVVPAMTMSTMLATPPSTMMKPEVLKKKAESGRKTPPGGEDFLLEEEMDDLAQFTDDPRTITRDRLEALAVRCIENLAEQGEFVTPRRVELLICKQLQIRSLRQVNVPLRRGIEDLKAVYDLSQKIGKVDAHITASLALRNVNTLYDTLEALRDGIPDKKSYDSLRMGPITKNPTVQRLFGIPSGCEVTEISCIDVFNKLRDYVRAKDLWSGRVDIQQFMEHLKEEYHVDDVFSLGVKIRSIALCMGAIKKAQKLDGEAIRGFYASVQETCQKDLESAYNSFRMKLMMQGEHGYTARQHYLSQQPHQVVKDVMEKLKTFIRAAKDLGVHNLEKDRRAIDSLEKDLCKSRIVQELFKFSVVMSNDQVVQSIHEYLEQLTGKQEQYNIQSLKKETIDKSAIVERLVKYFEKCFESRDFGISLKVLKDMEIKCAQHFKRDSFLDLGHETFLEFLLKNEKVSKILEENGGVSLGGGSSKMAASVYRPSLNDIVELILPIGDEKTVELIESVACYHYKVDKFSHLGLGPVKLVLDRHVTRKSRNVVCQTGSCYDSRILDVSKNRQGIFGQKSVSDALKCLNDCPLLDGLSEWSQWELVFAQNHGNLKDFVEKHGGTGTFNYHGNECQKDLSALELEPGKLVRLTPNTDDDKFREIVEDGNPVEVCGHLVSLVVLRGFRNAGLALMANVITTHLHKLCATLPGAPPCGGSRNLAVDFVRDCLCLLPLMFCEKVADQVFIVPLSSVLGKSESKTLMAKSCTEHKHSNRLAVLGHFLGIDQWQALFQTAANQRPRNKRFRYNQPIDDEEDDYYSDNFQDTSESESDSEQNVFESESEDSEDSEKEVEMKNTDAKETEDQIIEATATETKVLEPKIEEAQDVTNETAEEVHDVIEGEADVTLTEEDIVDDDVQIEVQADTDEVEQVSVEKEESPEQSHQLTKDENEDAKFEAEEDVSHELAEVILDGKEAVIAETDDQSKDGEATNENDPREIAGVKEVSDIISTEVSEAEAESLSTGDDGEDDKKEVLLNVPELVDIVATDVNEDDLDPKAMIDYIRRRRFGIGVELNQTARDLFNTQQKMLKRSLKRLSEDLYAKVTHFVLELVQNADDNNYDVTTPSLQFVLEKDKITVLNNESGFLNKHVKALCDVGNSTKPKDHVGFIGQKGIGFKSVFRVTDRPEVHSNGFSFCFDMVEDEIGYILPHWIEDEDDKDSKWRTKIVLPFKKETRRNIHSLINRFKDIHPSLLLFLHRLKSLTIENKISGTKTKMSRKDIGKRIVEIRHNKNTEQWLVVKRVLDVPKVKKEAKAEQTEVALAFPVSGDMPGKQSVFAFLPLRDYGFRFVVQGDFDLPSSREDLDADSAWNQWLRKEIAPTFISALKSFHNIHEDPIQAVKKFLLFVPREDEIMEFFKPVAKGILANLCGAELLPSVDGVARLPSQLVSGADKFVRETFKAEVLDKCLNLSYIHPDVITDNNRQLLHDLGVRALTTHDVISIVTSQSREWGGKSNPEVIRHLARVLVCVQRGLNDLDLHDQTLETLCDLPIIPDCRGQLVTLSGKAVFFPLIQGGDDFCRILSGDLTMVDPRLLMSLDPVANSQVQDLLERLGVKKISPRDIIAHHILPTYQSEGWKTKDRETLTAYVVFLRHFLQQTTQIISMKDLGDVIQLSTNQGLKNPARDSIHFTTNYGNETDLRRVFPDYDWCLLDQYPSQVTNGQWRDFFQKLGVIDFINVRQVKKKMTSDQLEAPLTDAKPRLPTDKVIEVIVDDYQSEELKSLIKSAVTSSEAPHEQMQHLLRLLARDWRRLQPFTKARVSETDENYYHDVMSSFAWTLTSQPWLPGYQKTVEDGKLTETRGSYLGKDLYAKTANIPELLSFHVPYLDPGKNADWRNLTDIMTFLKVHDRVSIEEVKAYFFQWIKEEEFTSYADHLRTIYMYFQQMIPPMHLDQMFYQDNAIFVPSKPITSKLVCGKFHSLEDVCWSDPGGLFANYQDELKGSDVPPVLTLDQYTETIYPNKPCQHIRDQPTLAMYRDLLYFICTFNPQCSSKMDDVIKCYHILINHREAAPYSGVQFRPRDWRKDFGKRKVIPTRRDIFVSLDDKPIIPDNERLEKLFADSANVHFLDFAPGKKTKRNRKPTQEVQDLENFFVHFLGVPNLSQSYDEEIVSTQIQAFTKLQNYFHNFISSLQKFLHRDYEEVYQILKQKNISEFLQNLKFYSVSQLEAVYTMKLLRGTVKTENRSCHIQEKEGIMYVHKDSMEEVGEIRTAIAEFFGCGDEVCMKDIRMFLMEFFPRLDSRSSELRKYKLPTEERLWEVKEAVVYVPPPPKPEPEEKVEQVTSEAPVLKSWPPPAPGGGKKASTQPQTGEVSWPKPPKPDTVEELPDLLRQRLEKAQSARAGNEGQRQSSTAATSSTLTSTQEDFLDSRPPVKQGATEARSDEKFAERQESREGHGYPQGQSQERGERPKQMQGHRGEGEGKKLVAKSSDNEPECRKEMGQGEGPVSAKVDRSEKSDKEPPGVVLGDFIPSAAASGESSSGNPPEGARVDIGAVPRTPQRRDRAPSADVTRTPQSVRQFRPDVIDDIPDERVFYQTGSPADVSSLVEVRLDVASDQKEIGRHGEDLVYKYLSTRIGKPLERGSNMADEESNKAANSTEIITSVKWMNDAHETGLPYDIELKTKNTENDCENIYFIEVKSTMSESKMYFETSQKELLFANDHKDHYDLYRVFGVGDKEKVKLVKLRNVAMAMERKTIRVFMVV